MMRQLFISAIFLLLCFVLTNCKRDGDQIYSDSEITEAPDQEILNAEIVFTKNERVTSVLKARRLNIYEKTGLTIADSAFQLDIFDEYGAHSSVLTADSGVVKGEDSLMAFGNVVVISDSGVVLETEVLFWDKIRGGVRSDTDVVLTTETDTLYGDGMIADEGLQNWEIFNPRGKSIRDLDRKRGSKAKKNDKP